LVNNQPWDEHGAWPDHGHTENPTAA
jgi:hypothetical protein